MASFDYFSQPQGPVIPINLFGDAATQGINAGNAKPSQLTSIIQGAIKGVGQGQGIVQGQQAIEANAQNAVIRENQINQLPEQNRQEALQTENMEITNKINQMKVRSAELTQNTDLLTQEQQSQNQLQIVQRQHDDLMIDKQISKDLTDPVKRGAIVTNPQYQDYLIRNPKIGEQTVGALQRLGAIDQGTADKLQDSFDSSKRDLFQKELLKQQAQTREALAKRNENAYYQAMEDPILSPMVDAAQKSGGQIRVEPHTSVSKDAEGRPEIKTSSTQFDVFSGDKKLNDKPLDPGPQLEKIQLYSVTSKAYNDSLKDAIGVNDKPSKTEDAKNAPPLPTLDSAPPGEATPAPTGTPADATNPNLTMEERLMAKRDKIRKDMQVQKEVRSAVTDYPESTRTPPPGEAFPQDTAVTPSGEAPIEQRSGLSNISFTESPYHPEVEIYNPIVKAVSLVELPQWKKDPNKASPAGAIGVMQVMPGTFKDVVNRYKNVPGLEHLKNANIYNPRDNAEVGAIYLAEQMRTFGSEPGNGLELALAAYNSGPGNVGEALTRARANGNPTWEGVKAELKKFLKTSAYNEVSVYPDKVLSKLYVRA